MAHHEYDCTPQKDPLDMAVHEDSAPPLSWRDDTPDPAEDGFKLGFVLGGIGGIGAGMVLALVLITGFPRLF